MILTLTMNPALDIYSRVDKIRPTEKMRCEQATVDPGGGGINVSRVIKRLGGDSIAVYSCGGYTGEIFQSLLSAEGVQQEPVKMQHSIRENFAVSELSSGNLYRFGFPGPTLQKAEAEAILQKIEDHKQAEFLVASGSLPPGVPDDFYARVAEVAKKHDIKFILDTSGKAYTEVLKVGAFLLKPNVNELDDLAGREATNEKDRKQLLLELLKKYPVECIVLSLGAKGAMLAYGNTVKHFPAVKVQNVSSIGAGDSMVAGMALRLSHGSSFEEAVQYGLACGSATIKSPGTELLQKKDVDELFREIKERD
ncbi:MAG: 1-phosphofructokinase family hexose kinase [Salinimicrobium sp.]